MSIEIIDKLIPKNNAFTGLVDARQIIGDSATNVLPYATLPAGITGGGNVPSGGAAAQYLQKVDGSNYNTQWVTLNSGIYNFFDYYPTAIGGLSLITTQLQNFLLWCQLQALRLKPSNLDDVQQRAKVIAYVPRAYLPVNCPIIVPEFVDFVCDGTLIRNGSIGTITDNYTGDTTTKALANRIQPTLIVVPRAHSTRHNIVCNSTGSDRGSGLVVGKTWGVSSVSITAAGSGYTNGDVLTFAQPSKAPYVAATATISGVDGSGAITSIAVSQIGSYGLPPVMQASQWTSTNGFSVFDSHNNIAVTGGTGTGASIAITWIKDFIGSAYSMGIGGMITDIQIGKTNIVQSQIYTDATYGSTFLMKHTGLNMVYDEFEGLAGYYGFDIEFGADMRFGMINPVKCEVPIRLAGCDSISGKVVIDTPTGDVPALFIDDATGINLWGYGFFRNLVNLGHVDYASIGIGYFTSTTKNTNIVLDLNLASFGQAGTDAAHLSSIGCPALYLANVDAFDIKLTISNRSPGYSGNIAVNNSFCSFGSNIGAGRIRGSINQTFGSLFVGTIPSGVDIDIWDADVSIVDASETATIGGTITTGDHVSLTFTNVNLVATYKWPRTVTYVTLGGDDTAAVAAGLVTAINADAILSVTGIYASRSGSIVTVKHMGSDANGTTLSKAVTGSATETVTFGASGVLAGAIYGGNVRAGGIYELHGSGAPIDGTHGTGWAKAPIGSKYTDTNAGDLYINTGSASSPSWKKVTHA